MSFFGLEEITDKKKDRLNVSKETMHRLQCEICPLNERSVTKHLRNPHMQPTGSSHPLIYMLGEAPGGEEDQEGEQFVGASGRLLRALIPKEFTADYLRWNNVVRTRPPGNRDPSPVEIECCRPSVAADIAMSRPTAIFGFGATPLHWAVDPGSKVRSIGKWNGRKVPVRINGWDCWYFPLLHPAYVLYMQDMDDRDDTEFLFQLNLHTAFQAVDAGLPPPTVLTEEDLRKDVWIVTGERIDDADHIVDFLRSLGSASVVGFDWETNRTRPYSAGAKILSAAFCDGERTMAFPLDHPGARWYHEKDRERVWEAVRDFLFNTPPACRKVSHHLGFEQEWAAHKFGRDVIYAGSWGDSMAQAYILDERPGTHSLDFLMLNHFGIHLKYISGLDVARLETAPLEEVLVYNGMDAKSHRLAYVRQIKELKNAGLMSTYHEHMKRVPVMVLTQLKGVPVHQATVHKFKNSYEDEIDQIEARIRELPEIVEFNKKTGRVFNPAAGKDILHVIQKQWNRHEFENADETVLEQIDHELCELVLDYRGAAKNLSTYVEPLLPGSEHFYPDGMLHPIINPSRTRTSRTASSDPNIQNFPKHENKEVRDQIAAPTGCKIVSIDWSGIQARNIAMESEDPFLIDSFWNDYDVHKDWAERITKRCPRWAGSLKSFREDEGLRKKLRQRAKNEFVFPSFFGAKAKSVSASLGIPTDDVYKLQDDLWRMFPGMPRWHSNVEKGYREYGYIEGLSGYRRRAPVDVNQRINSPIQADEALLVCDAMHRLKEFRKEQFQANLMVHDDLTFVWPTNKIDEYAEVVVKEMTRISYPWINTPMAVEMSIGDTWGSMKEVAKFSSVEIWGHKRAAA